jgi:hypothetical protein
MEYFQAEGGKLVVTASASVGGVSCDSDTVTVYITGCAIPNAKICTRVKCLYDPDSYLTLAPVQACFLY